MIYKIEKPAAADFVKTRVGRISIFKAHFGDTFDFVELMD